MLRLGWINALRIIGIRLLLGLAVTACRTSEETAAPTTDLAARLNSDTGTAVFEPIEVTYFTPPQQEGPYYPVEKPEDRDNDLVDLAGNDGDPVGELLNLSGVIYDAGGRRVEGILVEIWQTDNNGVYDHPNDPGTHQRDLNFQFYGESITGADGVYTFRTIVPGHYEPRPRHIHVKVRLNSDVILTTQFYFDDEISFGGDESHLVIQTSPAENDQGQPILVGERDIVLRINP